MEASNTSWILDEGRFRKVIGIRGSAPLMLPMKQVISKPMGEGLFGEGDKSFPSLLQ
jgi:hypothetical protein